MIQEKCTVVMLTYNGEVYLDKMLQSIKKQTYRPIQLIIADDASKDSTVRIEKEFQDKNSNTDFEIEIVSHAVNQGRSGNCNSIISKIEGQYIFLADQDDIWEKDKIEKQIKFLKNNPDCFGVSCDRRLIDQCGRILLESENMYMSVRHKRKIGFKENLSFKMNYPANCIGFRNSQAKEILFIPHEMEEPDRFRRMMILCRGKLGYINEPLVNYRIHANNISGNYYAQISKNPLKILASYIHANKRYNRIYADDDSLIIREAKRRFQIDLNEGPKYLRRKRIRVYYDAVLHLYHDIRHKRIGEFLKKQP